MRRAVISAAISIMSVALVFSSGPASADGSASAMEEVAVLPLPGATHLEFFTRTIDGVERTFGMAGSRSLLAANVANQAGGAGLNIIELTDPENPVLVVNIPCVNTRGALDSAYVPLDPPRDLDGDGVLYDGLIAIASNAALVNTCRLDPNGVPVPSSVTPNHRGRGLSIVALRQTARPGETLSYRWYGGDILKNAAGATFAWETVGDPAAHTVVAHPSLPIWYSGNQNLPDRSPTVEVTDARVWPPVTRSVDLPPTGVGPHDITFSPDGTRAFASSIDATFIWDTTDPANPVTISALTSPNLKIHHEAVLHPNGRHLIVVDEFVATSGAGNNPQCPGGGLHIFDLGPDRSLELAPVLVGQFYANDLSTPGLNTSTTPPQHRVDVACTAHEYSIAPDGNTMPMAWMGAGVRRLDSSSLNAAAALPVPTPVTLTEIGYYVAAETDVWAAKVHASTGDYVFVTDSEGWFRVLRPTA
jgi:hypothetical protein